MKIRYCYSSALDALYFLRKCKMSEADWMPLNFASKSEILQHSIYKDEYENLELFKHHFYPDVEKIQFDMSSLGLALSAYFRNKLTNISIDSIITAFENIDNFSNVVKSRITNQFNASHIYPLLDSLKNGLAEEIVLQLIHLQKNGWEELYTRHIVPLIESNITTNIQELKKYNIENLYKDISHLKNTAVLNYATVYINFFSFPYAFSFYQGAYSQCYTGNVPVDHFSVLAHELMHGFADDILINSYREYVSSVDYLKRCHSKLLSDYGAGDEEEFVKAAEYYLCLRSGKYTKSHLLSRAKEEYGGVCPVSIIVFDFLCKENDVPKDYNNWLKTLFVNKKLPVVDIEALIDKIK